MKFVDFYNIYSVCNIYYMYNYYLYISFAISKFCEPQTNLKNQKYSQI